MQAKRTLITLAKILGVIAGFVVLLIIFASVALQLPFVQRRAAAFIENTAEGSINGDLEIGRVTGNPLAGITLRDVTLAEGATEVFSAERVSVDYSLPALLRRTVLLDEVVIAGPKIVLRQDRQGRWNFERLIPPGKPEEPRAPEARRPWTVALRRVAIRDAAVTASRATRSGRETLFDAENLGFAAALHIEPEGDGNRIRLTLEDLRFDGRTPALNLADGDGTIVYDGETVVVEQLALATDDSRGTLNGTVRTLEDPRFDVTGEFPKIAFDDIRTFAPSIALEGAASATFAAAGTFASFKADWTLVYGDTTSKGTARVRPGMPAVDLAGTVNHFRPQEIIPGCTGRPRGKCPAGDLSFDVSLKARGNTVANLALDTDIDLRESVLNGIAIQGGKLAGALANGRLTVREGRVRTSSGTLTLSGEGIVSGLLAPPGRVSFKLKAGGRDIDVLGLAGVKGFGSNVDFTSDVSLARSPGGALTGAGTVNLGNSTVGELAITDAVLTGSYRGGRIEIENLSANTANGTLTASGLIDPAKGALDLSYTARVSDAELLQRLLPGVDVRGALESRGRITGTLKNPVVSGLLDGNGLGYAGVTVESLHAVATPNGATPYPVGRIELSATGVEAGGLSFGGVEFTADAGSETVRFSTNLQADGARSLAVSGVAELLRGGGIALTLDTLAVTAGTSTWTNTVPVEARISGGQVRLDDFNLAQGTRSVSLSGVLDAGETVNLDLALWSLNVSDVSRLIGRELPVTGDVYTRFRVRGTREAPVITGTVIINDGSAGGFPFDAVISSVTYRDRLLRFCAEMKGRGQDLLEASGTIPVDLSLAPAQGRFASSGIDARLFTRQLDLSLLEAFTGALQQPSGTFTADFSVTGSLDDPDVAGTLVVSTGAFRLNATGVTYREIDARIRAAGGRLVIEQLTARSGDGTLAVSGTVQLEDFQPVAADLAVQARSFPALDTEIFTGTVDADLRLLGAGGRPRLTGSARVLEGAFQIPSRPPIPVEEIIIVPPEGEGEPEIVNERRRTPFISSMTVNAVIVIPGNTWVRGQGINAEVEGRLRVTRTEYGPLMLTGEIHAVRGSYELRGRRLTIEEGTVTFAGGPRINPNLDVQAGTTIDDTDVTVRAAGTLEEPELTLTSDPARDESEILSLVLFGRSPGKLNEAESTILQRTTTQVIGELATEGIKGFLGRELAPDVLNVYTGEERGFSVGKYLTNRIFLRYDWRFGVENVSQTILDVDLNEWLSMRSQFGEERTAGITFFWSHDY